MPASIDPAFARPIFLPASGRPRRDCFPSGFGDGRPLALPSTPGMGSRTTGRIRCGRGAVLCSSRQVRHSSKIYKALPRYTAHARNKNRGISSNSFLNFPPCPALPNSSLSSFHGGGSGAATNFSTTYTHTTHDAGKSPRFLHARMSAPWAPRRRTATTLQTGLFNMLHTQVHLVFSSSCLRFRPTQEVMVSSRVLNVERFTGGRGGRTRRTGPCRGRRGRARR